MRVTLAAAITVFFAGAAAAQMAEPGALQSADTPDRPSSVPAAPPPPADAITVKIVCVRTDADTGSHIGSQKVCHTESQWAQIRANGAMTLENMRTRMNNAAPGQSIGAMR